MNFVCHYKRGDCWWSCVFLNRITGEQTLFCREEYHEDFRWMLRPGIELRPLQDHPPDSIDLWIGSGSNEFNWHSQGCPKDLVDFQMEFYNRLAVQIGHDFAFFDRSQLLSTLPPLSRLASGHILVCNAVPESNQSPNYDPKSMAALVEQLRDRHAVVTTCCVEDPAPFSFRAIAQLSFGAKLIIGTACGPIWPCLNQHTRHIPKMLILEQVNLDYGHKIEHAPNVSVLKELLTRDGFLS